MGKAGSFFFFYPYYSIRGRKTVQSVSCLLYSQIFRKNCVRFVSSLESDWVYCSDLVVDFEVVGLEVFFTAFEKIKSGFGLSLSGFRIACSLDIRIRFLFLFRILGSSLRMIGGLLRSGSIWLRCWCTYLCCVLAAAPHTRRYYFMASFHCVPISKTCLAAHCYFIIFVNFSFWLFSRNLFESWCFFFFESQ